MANKKKWMIGAGVLFALLLLVGLTAYEVTRNRNGQSSREEMLAMMPETASAVIYIDMADLRSSSFFTQLFRWAPKPELDRDYVQFLQATGFNYETDLDRVAVAIRRGQAESTALAIAEGKFDRKKIETFASRFGSLKTADGRTLFAVPLSGSNRKAYFTFLRPDRIAWANDSSYFFYHPDKKTASEWREHIARVEGTPVFAVLRQDAAVTLPEVPGGLHSPQLAALLAQLQWISISAKPEGGVLRVVAEGECLSEEIEHQLKDLLSGLIVLAQMGLNDPKTRKQMAPEIRAGYLQVLQSADVQQLDRGTSKAVRVVVDITPKLLESAQNTSAAVDPAH